MLNKPVKVAIRNFVFLKDVNNLPCMDVAFDFADSNGKAIPTLMTAEGIKMRIPLDQRTVAESAEHENLKKSIQGVLDSLEVLLRFEDPEPEDK